MAEQAKTKTISTAKGLVIVVIVAGLALLVFGSLYFYWIERPSAMKVPEIFSLSRVAGVNLNGNLQAYLKYDFCHKDSDCPAGSVCYTSLPCKTINGQEICGAEQGDLLCHKKCLDNSDCPEDMPVCKATNFLINNKDVLIKICKFK